MHPLWRAADRRRAVTVAEHVRKARLADDAHRLDRQAFAFDIIDGVPIVDDDQAVTSSHAELLAVARRQGRPRGAHDLMIAATAEATQRDVVSADRTAYSDRTWIAGSTT
jgi:tRNA(fMet)-specific endonuclease VapC